MSDKKAISNFRKLLSETKQLAKEKEKRILKEDYTKGHGDFSPPDDPYEGSEQEYNGHDIVGELVDIPSDETVGGTTNEEVLVDVRGEITGPGNLKDSVISFKAWKVAGQDPSGKPIKGEELDQKLVWNHLDWEPVIEKAAGSLKEKITNFNLKNKLKQAGSAIKNKITGSSSAQSQAAPNPASQPVEKSAEVIKEPELPNATELSQTLQQFITKTEQFFSQVKDKVRMGQQSYTLKEATEGDPEFSNWADRFSDPVDNIFDSIQMRVRGLKKDLEQLNREISKAK